ARTTVVVAARPVKPRANRTGAAPRVDQGGIRMRSRRLARRTLFTVAVVAGALVLGAPAWAAGPDFGPNVMIFDPSMSTAQIQSVVDSIYAQQVDSEFGTGRYALLFKPGTYGAAAPLIFSVGYYTQVAGLGASPTDVTLNGEVNVHNRCLGPGNCVALRSEERRVGKAWRPRSGEGVE